MEYNGAAIVAMVGKECVAIAGKLRVCSELFVCLCVCVVWSEWVL